jgi:hypothetical protein
MRMGCRCLTGCATAARTVPCSCMPSIFWSWTAWIYGASRSRRAKRPSRACCVGAHLAHDGESVFRHACKMGLEGIVSKRLGSRYRSGRSKDWLKFKNPEAPAVRREAEEDWGKERSR